MGSQQHPGWEHSPARAWGPTGPGHQGCEGLAGENAALWLGRAVSSSTVLKAGISRFLYFIFFQVLSRCEMSYSLQSVPIGKTWALHWHPQLKMPSNPLLDCTLCLYLLHPHFLDQLVVGAPGTATGMWEACSRTTHISQPMLPSGMPQPKPAMLQQWPRWQGGHRDVTEP